jgi:hypothetical protein
VSRQRHLDQAEELFFGPVVDREKIVAKLPQLVNAGMISVQAHLVISEKPLSESLSRLGRRRSLDFQPITLQEDLLSGELSGVIGRYEPRRVSGKLIAYSHPSHPKAWVILTIRPGDFESVILARLLNAVRPRCVRPIIRTEQIQQLFTELAGIPGMDSPGSDRHAEAAAPRVVQIGSRSHIQSPGARKPVEAFRRWTDLSIAEAFRDARESEQWVTAATLAFCFKGTAGRVQVGRDGVAKFSGTPTPVFEPVTAYISRVATERYEFLRGRERTRQNLFQNRPFDIAFRSVDLAADEERNLLRSVLRSIPNATCTVLHGNPYFHAVVVDYLDGSSYEVLILESRKMTVIPQGRATPASLQRLCRSVFKDFREGEITEALT